MPPEPPIRSRLRFAAFEKTSYPDGRCRVRVELEWKDGRVFEGEMTGIQTREGETRAAAEAALEAAGRATDGRLDLGLMGAKAVRVFDSWVVIVSARGTSDTSDYHLIGSYACPDDRTARGAAIAALDATNRILEKYVTS